MGLKIDLCFLHFVFLSGKPGSKVDVTELITERNPKLRAA